MMNRDGAPKAAMRGTAALVLALAGLALSGCATLAPPASGPAPQKAAPSRAPSAQAPAWVLAPYGTYPESKYLATVGTGASKAEAEKSALAALGNTFGQSVSSQSSAVRHYAEAVKGGEIKVDKSLAMSESIDLSSGQKILLGAETKEAWIDGQGRHYVLVVMDKLKSGMAYSQLLDRNDEAVKALVSAEGAEKYSLDMYRRYGLAIDIADVDTQLAGTLSVLNPAAAAARQVSMGDELRTQRLDIAQNIVFNVAVAGDRDNRIGQAISGVLTGRQFKAGEAAQARYRVEATLALSEVELKDNPNKFARYVIELRIVDARKGLVVATYSANGRAGQASYAEAEARALRDAEGAVTDGFGAAFSEYLSTYSEAAGKAVLGGQG
jgi:hypothetical protein